MAEIKTITINGQSYDLVATVSEAEMNQVKEEIRETIAGAYLPTAGGTVTGELVVNAGISLGRESSGEYINLVNESPDDATPVLCFFGSQSDDPVRLYNIAAPVDGKDAATKDYVDARIGESKRTVVMEEITGDFAYVDGAYAWQLSPAPFTLTAGQTYIAAFDGEEYELTAFTADSFAPGAIGIGNQVFLGGEDTGVPFLFGYVPSTDYAGCVTLLSDATHTVAIYQEAVSASVTVDSQLSDTSENPVQNKVITEVLSGIVSEILPVLPPKVTVEDNGKFLQVVNGAWAAVALQDVSEVGL